jgi:hypothetical protein
VKYHPAQCGALTKLGTPQLGPWQAGSLTGAVASERVTEARAWSPQRGRQPRSLECNGRRGPDGESDGSSRHESGP